MTTNNIDLSSLPFPNVIEQLDYEPLLQECKEDLIQRDPTLAKVLNFESEPLTKLIETFAYRLLLKTAEINHKAKSLMLAYAQGSDLDQLAANFNLTRLVIQQATDTTEAIFESDDALRRRVQLAPERYSAGSQGAYQYWGLSADGKVKDISIDTPKEGFVDVYVQSHKDEIAPKFLLDQVNKALDSETRRPLTDKVTIKPALPFPWSLKATLILFAGPDSDVVKQSAENALNEYIKKISASGYDVTLSGLYSSLHQGGVQKVILHEPTSDILIHKSQYSKCRNITIETAEFRDE